MSKSLSRILLWSVIASSIVLAPVFVHFPMIVTYNFSPSAPIGFYRINSAGKLKRRDFVVIQMSRRFSLLAEERHYMRADIPLIKRVAGLSGDLVCRKNEAIFIDGKQVATVLKRDTAGHLLPIWAGCRTLQRQEFFALNDAPNSFDSRIFGPLKTQNIIGIATPIYVWPRKNKALFLEKNRKEKQEQRDARSGKQDKTLVGSPLGNPCLHILWRAHNENTVWARILMKRLIFNQLERTQM